jgi:hypothetical protein
MILLFSIFAVSLVGMMIVPLRHLPEVRRAHMDDAAVPEAEDNSIARAYIAHSMTRIERWMQISAKHEFLKFLDVILSVFERFAGRVAGRTKSARLLVQERFRVIPRESLYWKSMNTWKKTSAHTARAYKAVEEEGLDISNHLA